MDKNLFYLDSYVFSVILIGLLGYLSIAPAWPLLIYVIVGFIAWSFFEYALHRWVFHGFLVSQHWPHHKDPSIGAPNSVSIGSFILLSTLLWCFFATPIVVAILAGLVLGYLCYLFIHHIDHRRIIYPNQWFYRIREHHIGHHHYAGGNYGVTTRFWDYVLGTRL